MKLRNHQNPSMWAGGDASGIGSFGVLQIVDGEIFSDDMPLLQYLQQYSGRKAMWEFVFPEEAEYEIDPKILPLVQALQSKGIRTMASCESHLELRWEKQYERRAFVSVWVPSVNRLAIPEGWEVVSTGHKNIDKLQTKLEATDEASLKKVHELITSAVEFYGG